MTAATLFSNRIFAAFTAFQLCLNSAKAATIHAVSRPERWALLSCCDWYPDGFSFPSNHAALLREDSKDSTTRDQ